MRPSRSARIIADCRRDAGAAAVVVGTQHVAHITADLFPVAIPAGTEGLGLHHVEFLSRLQGHKPICIGDLRFDLRCPVVPGILNIQGGEFGKLNSHTHLQPSLAENLFFYDKEGNIVDGRVMTLENVVTKTGADFANAIATLDINNTTYTGLHKEPGLVLSIFDSVVAAEHYDISYTENLLPGEATVTVSAKGIYTGATTATLNIAKGYLQVMENPTATHEFGDIYSAS